MALSILIDDPIDPSREKMMCIGQGQGLEMSRVLFVYSLLVISLSVNAEQRLGLNDLGRFDTSRDEVVFDRVTNLTWQTCSFGQKLDKDFGCEIVVPTYRWDNAKNISRNEWRLPRREELETIIDELRNRDKVAPRIKSTVFPRLNKTQLKYWTVEAAGQSEAWYINFGLGPIAGKADKNSELAVRLVKGTFVPPAPEIKPPKDIYEFIGRRNDCNHFAGEFSGMPNDRVRDNHIDKEMTELRCNSIEADEKRLRNKYQSKPEMLKWLSKRTE